MELCEEGLERTRLEKKPSDKQDSSNVENDLGGPDPSAVGFHNTPQFVSRYHCLYPPK